MFQVPYKTQPNFEKISVGDPEIGIIELTRMYGLTPAEKLTIKELAGEELESQQKIISVCQTIVEKHNTELKKKIAALKINEENLRASVADYYQVQKNPKRKGFETVSEKESVSPEQMQKNRIELEEILIELEQIQDKFVGVGQFYQALVTGDSYSVLDKMPTALTKILNSNKMLEESGQKREKAYVLAMFKCRLNFPKIELKDVESFQEQNPNLAQKIVEFCFLEQGGKDAWLNHESESEVVSNKELTDEDFKSDLALEAA